MFTFGSPEDTATLLIADQGRTGPGLPEGPMNEHLEKDLKVDLTYIKMAYHDAVSQGLDEEVLLEIEKRFDDVYKKLLTVSATFEDFVVNGRHGFLTGRTESQKKKYFAMIKDNKKASD